MASPAPPPSLPLSARLILEDGVGRVTLRSRLEAASSFLLIERTQQTPDASGRPRWTIRRSVGPGADGPWKPSVEQSFIQTPAGDAAISEEINHLEKVELVFDPPLIVMPAELPPPTSGQAPFTQETYLRVFPLGRRQPIKAQGPVRQHIAHDGGSLIDIASGPLAAQRITQTFEASLKPAEVRNLTHQWFIPGVGLIAEEREERTHVFGVQTRRNRESWVVSERPCGG